MSSGLFSFLFYAADIEGPSALMFVTTQPPRDQRSLSSLSYLLQLLEETCIYGYAGGGFTPKVFMSLLHSHYTPLYLQLQS